MRLIPEVTYEIIKKYEGYSSKRYIDADGNDTIGYGHECKKGDGLDVISMAQADNLLDYDINMAAQAVLRLTTEVQLNDNQFAALIDFVFNLGAGSFQASTLRMVINRGDFEEAPEQFKKWIYGNNRKLPGLIERRQAEVNLFTS
jgi:lysozyme